MLKLKRLVQYNIIVRGFTLIELLVVISIISTLMSIMLPALNGAREQGRRVVCSSNLRQLTFAWTMYAMDNDDKLCSPETLWVHDDYGLPSGGLGPRWVGDGPFPGELHVNPIGGTAIAITDGVLWSYTQMLDLYKCKSDVSNKLRSYSISRVMGEDKVVLRHPDNASFNNLANIIRPAERMVFVDARTSAGDDWVGDSFWPLGYTNPLRWHNTPLWHGCDITARHNNGCNLSFADGHCGYWKYKDYRTVKFANFQIKEEEEIKISIGNPDLERMIELLKGR